MDIDGLHPENIGRLVAGDARYKPCTPRGIQRLLAAADVETEGKDAVVVGRSRLVGKPMANLFIQYGDGGTRRRRSVTPGPRTSRRRRARRMSSSPRRASRR